jgi:hypothetical protein
MSPNDALGKVLPETSRQEKKLYEAVSATFKAALPTSATSLTRNLVSSLADGEASQESSYESSYAHKSGDVSSLGGPSGFGADRTATDLPGLPESDEPIGTDPMMKYRMATALYQEVQLLNQYILDVARRKNLEPYVVRLQVSVMPKARNLPLDTYVNLSFFQGTDAKTLSSPAPVVPLLVTDNVEANSAASSSLEVSQLALALSAMLEGADMTGEAERLREAAESVLGRDFNSLLTVGSLGEHGLRVRLGALQRTLGTNGARYAALPQTHNVTVVLFAKRGEVNCADPQDHFSADVCDDKSNDAISVEDALKSWKLKQKANSANLRLAQEAPAPFKFSRDIRYVAHAQFVHVQSGAVVPPRKKTFEDGVYSALAHNYQEMTGRCAESSWSFSKDCVDVEAELNRLNAFVQSDDFINFRKATCVNASTKAAETCEKRAHRLWSLMNNANVGSSISEGSFEIRQVLPRFGDTLDSLKVQSGGQALVISDDTKTAVVQIPDIADAVERFTQVEAVCNVCPKDKPNCDSPKGKYTVPADSIKSVRVKNHIRATFPSLIKLEDQVGKPAAKDSDEEANGEANIQATAETGQEASNQAGRKREKASKAYKCDWSLSLRYRDPFTPKLDFNRTLGAHLLRTKKPTKKAHHKVIANNSFVKLKDGQATIEFVVLPDKDAEHVDITLQNASVDYENSAIKLLKADDEKSCGDLLPAESGASFRIKEKCWVQAKLTNLVTKTVVLKSKAKNDVSGPDLTFYVHETKPVEKKKRKRKYQDDECEEGEECDE